MLALLCRLQKSKPVILCGDLNVAAEDIDVFKPEGHHHDAGFTDDERGWHRKLKEEAGLIDVWRMLNKEVSSFTWFSSIEARMLDVGMRLDYILVSHKLLMPGPCPWLAFAEHRRDILGSDHCPVLLELQRINT